MVALLVCISTIGIVIATSLNKEYYTWTTDCSNTKTTLKVCPECNWHLICEESHSMLPTLGCKHTLEFCSPDRKDIGIGDIIAYQTPDHPNLSFVVHRVVGMKGKRYITQGDGNTDRDNYPVRYIDIFGKLKVIR